MMNSYSREFAIDELKWPFVCCNHGLVRVAKSNDWVERGLSNRDGMNVNRGGERMFTSSQSSFVTRARKPIRVQRSFFFVKNLLKSFFRSTDGRPSLV